MKFILWTVVWFGLGFLERFLEHGFANAEKYRSFYTDDIRGGAAIIHYVLWIVIYVSFIKGG